MALRRATTAAMLKVGGRDRVSDTAAGRSVTTSHQPAPITQRPRPASSSPSSVKDAARAVRGVVSERPLRRQQVRGVADDLVQASRALC
jgi:hypothetical protein